MEIAITGLQPNAPYMIVGWQPRLQLNANGFTSLECISNFWRVFFAFSTFDRICLNRIHQIHQCANYIRWWRLLTMSLYVNFMWEVIYILLNHTYTCCIFNGIFYNFTFYGSYAQYVFKLYIYLCYLHNIFLEIIVSKTCNTSIILSKERHVIFVYCISSKDAF